MGHTLPTLPGLSPVLRRVKVRPCSAWRAVWREGYSLRLLRDDVLAGCVVGIVALPLAMALAIASGVPPQHGLYTAIVAGGLIAVLGGSRVQVSGPTAAFVVILAPISAKFGIAGLALATFMAGLILMLMGVLRLGRLIQFIPHPVTTGFTAGIAVVIATLQVKDFLGLDMHPLSAEASYFERVAALVEALPSLRWAELVIGGCTLALLLLWPRVTRKIPPALIALTLAALGGLLIARLWPEAAAATIQSRFGSAEHPYGIPQQPPLPVLPWRLAGPVDAAGQASAFVLSFDTIRQLLPSAIAIAMLGAIESLLSAVVADGMSGHRHDPDAELLAQGTGNVIAPFFGGIAATGAIARTAANIRNGARSPIAAVVHALFILAAMLLLAPLLGYLPMAALAALLLVVAWNMSEARHFVYTFRVAPRSDVIVLAACFALTVIFDMTIAVFAGVMLAALLFMQRMAEISQARLIGESHPLIGDDWPEGLVVYEVAGPLFFGAAQRAMSQLQRVDRGVRVVLMDLSAVPVIDATGLASLASTVDKLYRSQVFVILGGVQAQPAAVLERARWSHHEGRIGIFHSLPHAVDTARSLAHLIESEPQRASLDLYPEEAGH